MGYAEFVCRAGGSNMNGGRLNSNAEPATTPVFSATNGAWNTGTKVFTPTSGNPSLTVTVGDFAHVFADGSTTPTYIARVTAVSSTTITLALASTGTSPGTVGSGMSINVGGAWLGPNGTDPFPFSASGGCGLYGGLTAINGDRPRLNMKNDQTYNMTAGIGWNVGGGNASTKVQGYTTTFGDGGRATIDGGTSGAAYALFSNTGNQAFMEDLIFQNNGATGSASLFLTSTSGNGKGIFKRCTFKNSRGNGLDLQNGGGSNSRVIECEAYNNNLSNTAGQAGFCGNTVATFIRSYSHSNPGSNSAGFTITNGNCLLNCIAESNGGAGFSATGDDVIMLGCDAYNNASHGIVYGAVGGAGLGVVENCNLFKNGGWGIQFTGNGGGAMTMIAHNCAFGSGTMANTSGTYSQANTTLADIFEISGVIVYAANQTPWRAPDTGDFSIINPSGFRAGRGLFLQTQNGKYGTFGYPDIGAAQHQEGATMATKFRTSIWSAQTLTAGAGNTTSSTIDLSMGYGAQLDVTLTNGATGPTVPAQVQVQVANDAAGTLWTNFGGPLVGDSVNSSVNNFSVTIPASAAAVRLVAGSNTAQNVTVNADLSNLISI